MADAVERPHEFGHDAVIVCDNLLRIYQTDTVEVQALQGLDLLVHDGEMIAIVGASGSGKSTLLQVLAGVDAATAGRARVAGHDLLGMTRRERVHYRRQVVGFVRQQSTRNLVPYLTASQVVDLPLSFAGVPRRERKQRTAELFDTLGVPHCAHLKPHQMSGGEQQRVAICVALANRPEVLLTDEPTGELDSTSAQEVFAALRTANTEWGTTVVIVTHDSRCERSGGAHGRHPGRSHQQRGPAQRRGGGRPGDRRGVRRHGPSRAASRCPASSARHWS